MRRRRSRSNSSNREDGKCRKVEEEGGGCTDTSESTARCIDDPLAECDDDPHFSSTKEESDTPTRSTLLNLVAHNNRGFRVVTCEDSDEDGEEEVEEHFSHDTSDNSLSTRDRNDSLLSIDK